MRFTEARTYILDRLEKELPAHLRYHSPDHVRDVYAAAEAIGESEGISNHEMILLLTAALFHDSGFLISQQDHEMHSCAIAREQLPQFGFGEQEIEVICGMIMATRIPQSPATLLEQIICDADLDYLGRDDFFPIGRRLFDELKHLGVLQSEEEWNRMQVRFLEHHAYFTDTAIRLRKPRKEAHLREIREMLGI